MATATLKYDLSNQDDVLEHTRAVRSTDMAMALWQFAYNNRKALEKKIDEQLRDDEKTTIAYETLHMVYKSFWAIMKDNDLNIDKLIQ